MRQECAGEGERFSSFTSSPCSSLASHQCFAGFLVHFACSIVGGDGNGAGGGCEDDGDGAG
jgi:hypothetical protein